MMSSPKTLIVLVAVWVLVPKVAAICAFANAHPNSAGAYLVARAASSARVASSITRYGEASYFDCSETTYDVQISVSCQATNLIALVAIEDSVQYALRWYGGGDLVQVNKQRLVLANYGTAGPVTASVAVWGSELWQQVVTIPSGYGQSVTIDYMLPTGEIRIKIGAFDPAGQLLAEAGPIRSSPEGNSEVSQLTVLTQSSDGTIQLAHFSGCGESECNTCNSNPEPGLRAHEFAFLGIFAAILLLCLLYTISTFLCIHQMRRTQSARVEDIQLNPIKSCPACVMNTKSEIAGPCATDCELCQDVASADSFIKELRGLLATEQSLNPDENFFSAGFTSKDATRLAARLTEKYHVVTTPMIVFEYNTLRKLSTWVATQLSDKRLQEQEYMKFDSGDYRLVCQPTTQHSSLSSFFVLGVHLLGLASLPVIWAIAIFPGWLLLGLVAQHVDQEASLYMLPLLVLPLLMCQIVIVVLLRCLVPVGTGSYKLWSLPFVKWWYGQLLFRTVHAAASPLFEGSIFMVYWLRLLGADLGCGVRVSITEGSCFELLSIGNSSSIVSSVYCHDIWTGLLHIRPVRIGKGCSNSTGSVVLPGTVMEDGAQLMPNSSVCCATLSTGKWIGTPAQPHEQLFGAGVCQAGSRPVPNQPGPTIGLHEPASIIIGPAEISDGTSSGLDSNECITLASIGVVPQQSNKSKSINPRHATRRQEPVASLQPRTGTEVAAAPTTLLNPILLAQAKDALELERASWASDENTIGAPEQQEPTQPAHATVAHALRHWNQLQPDKTLYTWLDDKGQEQTSWSYLDLEMWANAVCCALLHKWGCKQNDRAVLMYLPGLDFIAAFWGCLFAGVIAVPVYPVDLRGKKFELEVDRFSRIAADCEPKLVLSHGEYLGHKRLHGLANMFGSSSWPEGLEFEATDDLEPRTDCGTDYTPGLDQLAFLQFTSGSTGDPKGVMLSHGNIAHNVQTISSTWNLKAQDTAVSWLPQYHDMGLIGYFMVPAWVGGACTHMSPMMFLHKPGLWLATISRCKATCVSAPNFAFQRCVDKLQDIVREYPMESLALGQLKYAMNAAEPIRPSTLEAFAQSYSGAGFRPEQWACTYGLAENVIYVSGFSHEPALLTVQRNAMEGGLAVLSESLNDDCIELVGCGKPWPGCGIGIKIVDAHTLAEAAANQVAEIWVSGPSKAQGYWGKPQLSRDTFQATIQDDPTGTKYLRTGDLGFIHEGELYVCGRLKDLIIVRGKNYYPQDIERTAEASHSLLKPGCSAAFSLEAAGEERLVVVAEVRGELPERTLQAVMEAMRNTVLADSGLELQAVLLLEERTVPKTTSGKIKRRACSQGFQDWAGLPTDSGHKVSLTDVGYYVSSTWSLPHRRTEMQSDQPGRFVLRQLLQFLGIVFVPYYMFGLALPPVYILLYIPPTTIVSHLALLIFGVLALLLWVLLQMVMLVQMQWILVGQLRDGQQCHVDSCTAVRLWCADALGDLIRKLLTLFQYSVLKHFYLNLLGGRISLKSRTVCFFWSSISLIEIGANTFVSNVQLCTTSSIDNGMRTFCRLSIGSHCDVALKSVVAGTVNDQSMVGSLTWIPQDRAVPTKRTALGTPVKFFDIGFGDSKVPNLPSRPYWFSAALLTWLLCGIPLLLFVVLLPSYEVLWSYDNIAMQFALGGCNRPEHVYHFGRQDASLAQCSDLVAQLLWSVFDPSDAGGVLEWLVVYKCAFWLLLPALAVLQLILKWCVVGRYRPMETTNILDQVNSDTHVAQALRTFMFLQFHYLGLGLRVHELRGTPFWSSFLRASGSHIGVHTYNDSVFGHLDFDLVSIGHDSCLNAESYQIGHVFQYGALQFNRVTIGDHCNIGCNAQVVPGVTMQSKSSLCAVSRAFNGEVRHA